MTENNNGPADNGSASESSYTFSAGMWDSVFAVPSELVDRHLRLAGGAQIKVMLYLLRRCGKRTGLAELSRAAGLSEGDTRDALDYWTRAGLIKEHDGIIEPSREENTMHTEYAAYQENESINMQQERTVPERTAESAVPDTEKAPEKTPEEKQPKPKKSEKVRYSYDECVDMINDTPELRQMLAVLEGILSKQLNHTEISVFVSLVRYYGLPTTCVAMLVEYCRGIGKSSIAYIEQTGIGWSGEEIFTVEQADAKIKRMRMLSSAWTVVRGTLGIPERSPTETEQTMSAVWVEEWKIAPDVIKLAYDRCVDVKGKPSFRYMNGIIKRWHDQGLSEAEDIIASEREGRKDNKAEKPQNGGRYAPTYDISEIEKLLDEEWASGDQ